MLSARFGQPGKGGKEVALHFGVESAEPLEGVSFPPARLPEEAEDLRAEVRAFLSEELAAGAFELRCDGWFNGYSPEFSRKLGKRNWLGMTWPKRYGGHEQSSLERSEHTALWHRGAEDALLAGHRPRRVLLLHWYERARERLGSRLRPDERGAGGRRVARQRHEDLDRRRPPVPLLHRALPHVSPR